MTSRPRLKIDRRVLPVIRRARRAGQPWEGVARTLNQNGLLTASGRPWTSQTARLAATTRGHYLARHLDRSERCDTAKG